MLDAKTIETIKATIPPVAQLGTKLTAHFYDRMFEHDPEVKDIFNMAHQASGQQREALFNAVAAYAMNIENPSVLGSAVEKIAHKHCSLLILPDQYSIVGRNLLASIDELLSPGQEVIDAWATAYGLLTDILVKREEEIYKSNEDKKGGWRGTREFKLVEKKEESSIITSFVFEPVDGGAVADYNVGQYLGIFVSDPAFENRQIRQYSISQAPNGKSYRISVKREGEGKISNYLHDKVKVGDVVLLTPPVGDFFLEQDKVKNVCLLSGGVGITPMLAMLQQLSNSNFAGNVEWVHVAHDAKTIALQDEVKSFGSKLAHFNQTTYLTQGGCSCAKTGRPNVKEIADKLKGQDVDFYMCGPVSFMQDMAQGLLAEGVDKSKIHYEVFGPHKII